MIRAIFHSDLDRMTAWIEPLRRLIPSIDLRPAGAFEEPASVDVAIIWKPPADLHRYTGLKAILSLGAGVDQLDLPSLPRHVPLARLRDVTLTREMRDYCRLAVTRYQRDFHLHERHSRDGGPWRYDLPRLPSEWTVGVLGLGELGGAVASELASAGFRVSGWSRNPKSIANVRSHVGERGLSEIAATSDVLVNLLPLTPETEDILDRRLFETMRKGSYLINAGRGRHLVEQDLLDALNRDHLAGATLDVFRTEPLPPDHPFWRHPRILVTPHVAAASHPETAAPQVADNIIRAMRGDPLLNLVDRERGY
jgi:glyoxylate/hydroxypyruvate reductase A